jgi:phospholipid/cholesterol/gamma-HCH transport system permease protein
VELIAATVSGAFTAVFRLILARPTLVDVECFSQLFSLGVQMLPAVFILTMLYGFLAALIIVAFLPNPDTFFNLVSAFLGEASLRLLVPFAVTNYVLTRGIVALVTDLSSMRASQEFEALTTCGISPIRYVLVPRALAIALLTPLAALICIPSSAIGVYLGAVVQFKLSFWRVIETFTSAITPQEIASAISKAFLVGFGLPICGAYFALNSAKITSKPIGQITAQAVSLSLLATTAVNVLFYLYS